MYRKFYKAVYRLFWRCRGCSTGHSAGVLKVVQVFTGTSTGCLRVSRQIDAKTRDRKSRQTQIDPGGKKINKTK